MNASHGAGEDRRVTMKGVKGQGIWIAAKTAGEKLKDSVT